MRVGGVHTLNSAPPHHVDMIQVARPEGFELPHTRSIHGHHALRVAPVGCSMGALQVDRRRGSSL